MTKSLSAAILLGVLCLGFTGAASAASATFTDLGTIPNAYSSSTYTGWAINASGEAVGYAQVREYSLDPGHQQAWVYNAGTMTDLNLNSAGLDGLGRQPAAAFGINDSGTIVGFAFNSSLTNGTRAMVTSGGVMTDLDASNSSIVQSRAYGINASGTVVGAYYTTTSSQWQPGIYTYSGTYNGTTFSGGTWSLTNIGNVLGDQGGSAGLALAINDAGTITGYAPTPSNPGYYHAFLLPSGSTSGIDLGAQSGYNDSLGEGIASNGDIAGYSYAGTSFSYTRISLHPRQRLSDDPAANAEHR